MKSASTSFVTAAMFAFSILAVSPALAGPANALKDLVGVKGSSGEAELQARGYSFISSKVDGNKIKSFWWHAQNGNCVRIITKDGRYDEISDASNSHCDQESGGASSGKKVNVSDVKGMDSIKAFDVMTSRGFAGVDTITTGNTIYGIYYNRSTKQCIQLTNTDNKVYDVSDIQTHPKCQ